MKSDSVNILGMGRIHSIDREGIGQRDVFRKEVKFKVAREKKSIL
jgi:hypothetical protein